MSMLERRETQGSLSLGFREIQGMRTLTLVTMVLAATNIAVAADAPEASAAVIGAPAALTLEPGAITLAGPRARQQLLVRGTERSEVAVAAVEARAGGKLAGADPCRGVAHGVERFLAFPL